MPSQDVIRIKLFYSALHLGLNTRFFFLRGSRGVVPAKQSDLILSIWSLLLFAVSSSLSQPQEHFTLSLSSYLYQAIFILLKIFIVLCLLEPKNKTTVHAYKLWSALFLILKNPEALCTHVQFTNYLFHLPITCMSHWNLRWITCSWLEGTCEDQRSKNAVVH